VGISNLTQLKETLEFRNEGSPKTIARQKKPEIPEKRVQRQGTSADFLIYQSSLLVTK
jgi:hypothetical protein